MECPKEILMMWEIVQASLREEYTAAFCDLWYKDITPGKYNETSKTLIFDTKSTFIAKQLFEKHKTKLEDKFSTLCGLDVILGFHSLEEDNPLDVEMLRRTRDQYGEKSEKALRDRLLYENAPVEDGAEKAIRSRYTFKNFIVGETNKFARAACWKVANNPSNEWNPLFIYGPSGVGKTHLMYAVVNEILMQNPTAKVLYTKGEEFVNYMIECLSHKSMSAFRDRYRECDVLLIDDIQFIAGKSGTQEEFFNTFDTLFTDGKQIILASDRPPRDINPLSERLRSRFEQGLLADIGLPDLELRTAIIKKKTEDMDLSLPDEVLNYLAENLRSNIRQLEGAIKKLAAKSMLDGRNITLELARDCVSDLLGDTEPLNVTIDKIFAAVYKKFDISKEELIGKKRTKEIAKVRHIAIHLIREITEISLPHIGKLFNRDHGTVFSSLEVVKKQILSDPLYAADIENIKKEIEETK
ncbi:MAG: chromosomal replication initiator protein DnaA [Ruminococcaceae bacterium]|nr:chromosomal replication initiator protein DnaA [Oscillospiraceae bacterium]